MINNYCWCLSLFIIHLNVFDLLKIHFIHNFLENFYLFIQFTLFIMFIFLINYQNLLNIIYLIQILKFKVIHFLSSLILNLNYHFVCYLYYKLMGNVWYINLLIINSINNITILNKIILII
jgi:hypothetical protein